MKQLIGCYVEGGATARICEYDQTFLPLKF